MDFSKFKCRFLSTERIRTKAEEFKSKHWPGNELPVDMERVIEDGLGLNIIPVKELAAGYEIDAWLTSDMKSIMVDHDYYMDDRNRYERRLRFSFAHEIGHRVLHYDIISLMNFDKPELYYEFITKLPEKEYDKFEWQANEFAGSFLVPRSTLRDEVGKAVDRLRKIPRAARMLEEEPWQILSRLSPQLSEPFGVSEKVIEIRVQREKLWPL
ncbi:MAG: ImmA/IrrE family metallo-endopeptidase [Armatimonadetes bacterium]|nr:ImmA/IrrE family metallo-endopeptidase [Armatimonadota bacterium]